MALVKAQPHVLQKNCDLRPTNSKPFSGRSSASGEREGVGSLGHQPDAVGVGAGHRGLPWPAAGDAAATRLPCGVSRFAPRRERAQPLPDGWRSRAAATTMSAIAADA